MNLTELKTKNPGDLLAYAEELEIENASTLRKQDMMFAILKQLAENDTPIFGTGVLEVLQDGFGFLRSPGVQLPARSGRHLRLSQPGPALQPAQRRHGGGTDPLAQGRRAVFRASEDQRHQLREPGQRPPPHQTSTT